MPGVREDPLNVTETTIGDSNAKFFMTKKQEHEIRDQGIYSLYKHGKTYSEIARLYNISASRIGMICRKMKYLETKKRGKEQ